MKLYFNFLVVLEEIIHIFASNQTLPLSNFITYFEDDRTFEIRAGPLEDKLTEKYYQYIFIILRFMRLNISNRTYSYAVST